MNKVLEKNKPLFCYQIKCPIQPQHLWHEIPVNKPNPITEKMPKLSRLLSELLLTGQIQEDHMKMVNAEFADTMFYTERNESGYSRSLRRLLERTLI